VLFNVDMGQESLKAIRTGAIR